MGAVLEKVDAWKLIQEEITDKNNRQTESIMSLGNGYMGARGNYEEKYSGNTLKGTYFAGVWVPDRTRVGWWKNGYPKYYGKVINAPDFLSFSLSVGGKEVDLHSADMPSFYREVDMKSGVMRREMTLETELGTFKVESERFFSIVEKPICVMRYAVHNISLQGELTIKTGISANVFNTDANYGEQFWKDVETKERKNSLYLSAMTKENEFDIKRYRVGIHAAVSSTGEGNCTIQNENGEVCKIFRRTFRTGGECLTIEKIVSVVTTRDYPEAELEKKGQEASEGAVEKGSALLEAEQKAAWERRWEMCDVAIQGDIPAQQGIRFNLFQLLSTYDGEDERLNIGPKGFTGEKYGGAAYYDTEGYCFPMYLSIAGPQVARSLLLFRYNMLERAKENAGKIGMKGAFYPMVTFNGEECHNEWEITFEELHRNAAMAYAIYCYTVYTGDESYCREYGIHVLIEIARFWASRCNYQTEKDKYMLIGVSAPNEYENNINNNWLTNYMAKWCIEYALECADRYDYTLMEEERSHMEEIAAKMYLNMDEETGFIMQQDGFLDKELLPVSSIPPEELPLCKHWSWDRILRSCFIKQADVILAFYYFPERFTKKQKKVNFEFYEPMTVHESSLSPSMYSIAASGYGNKEAAYRLYQRAARLDLDDMNCDTEDGLHITSMAGSWLAIVNGFAGMQYHNGYLSFEPCCPEKWECVTCRMNYRGRILSISFDTDRFCLRVLEGDDIVFQVCGREYECRQGCEKTIALS